MAMEKQKKLVRLLMEKTAKGELEWKSTIKDDAFQVSFANSGVRIAATEGNEGTTDYHIILLNSEGAIVDSFSDIDLDSENRASNGRLEWFQRLRDLFDTARRTALGSEKILDDILSELDDIPF